MLTLTVEKLNGIKPINSIWERMKLNNNSSLSFCKNLIVIIGYRNKWASELVEELWDKYSHGVFHHS